MTGPSRDELFRTNVSYAKMMLGKRKLAEYLDWFASQGLPDDPSPIEQAAIELLGLDDGRSIASVVDQEMVLRALYDDD